MGERMYYYTDFNTFKLILQNGTLRFKESTCSCLLYTSDAADE